MGTPDLTSTDACARPLRRDAERNRRRILDAAAEVFAARGLGVTMDDIADHAGVGVGTVYRRFPSKELLIDALFEDRIGELVVMGQEALGEDDPWEALGRFLERGLALQAANRGLKEIVFGSDQGTALAKGARARVAPLTELLVRRAQANGALRSDVVASDVPLLQFIVSSVAELTAPHAPELWRRYLALVLDGLRTPDPHPLPQPGKIGRAHV